eukprot:NODE_1441_length_950_cov_461.270810_g1115_i0.p1 GENE.NODE_1441_length_950_cov_461.270810_g1115_i0~~NODE_1441_length_950_cov_461.270810_g1115_i0.p1  ORF type:complete len:213 (+),score=60.54 NODE_1441_length_950_cov_461.270810_g1115_i0:62-700(+)
MAPKASAKSKAPAKKAPAKATKAAPPPKKGSKQGSKKTASHAKPVPTMSYHARIAQRDAKIGANKKGKRTPGGTRPRNILTARKKTQKKGHKLWTTVQFHRPYTQRLLGKKKYARRSGRAVTSGTKLDHFRMLKFPLTTESAMKKIEDTNTLVFVCDIRATKKKIRRAVHKMYDIKALKVNTLIRPDGLKKAFVRLHPDFDALDTANKIGIL